MKLATHLSASHSRICCHISVIIFLCAYFMQVHYVVTVYSLCSQKGAEPLYGVLLFFFIQYKMVKKKMNMMFQAAKVWRNQSQWHFCVVNSTLFSHSFMVFASIETRQ